jgi:HlyD family secretion protein
MPRLTATVLAAVLLAGCNEAPRNAHQGYIEGEYMLLASPNAGRLVRLHVRRGDQVSAGVPLFALEQESERAARREAGERVHAAEARLENLRGARRAPEIEAARAQLEQASAARALSASQLAQQERLFQGGFISQARLDEARTAHARDAARVAEAQAQLRVLRQPLGRSAELQAAESEVAAARAALAQSEWRLAQKSVAAPAAGLVQDTFYVEGEWVAAGRPVVSLLPPGNVKVRFFVPETVVGGVAPGRAVQVSCDGCGAPFRATVSFVAPQAEYTPPVLYSKDSRARLVFLVEARPEPVQAARLRPGQPVDVTLVAP